LGGLTRRKAHILFEKFGPGYMPANLTGWLLLFTYLAFVLPFLIIPEMVFPHSRIVSGYQVAAFLLFWWLGLRFARRHSA
jgi:hypothetical protein